MPKLNALLLAACLLWPAALAAQTPATPMRRADAEPAPAPAPVPVPVVPTVTVPATLSVNPGAWVFIRPVTNGTRVRWKLSPGAASGLSVFPSELLSDRTAFVASALNAPGTYTVYFWTSLKDELSDIAECQVTVTGPVVPPPPPTPPTPPAPAEPLTLAIQPLYNADAGAGKAEHLKTLVALYRQVATTTADDASLKTVGDLYAKVKAASSSLFTPQDLPAVRQYLATQLQAKLPTTASAPLDAPTRATVKAVFGQIATALEGVK